MVSFSSNKNSKRNEQKNKTKSDFPFISASDIERYGYCPMSWWLNYEGMKVNDEVLQKGTKEHEKLIKKISKVKEHEGQSRTSEFNIKLFAFIAVILAINAIVIIFPNPVIKDFLIYMGLIWLLLAIVYYFYYLFKGEFKRTKLITQSITTNIYDNIQKKFIPSSSKNKKDDTKSTPGGWKQTAFYFIIIAFGLAFNGVSYLQPVDPELMSEIFMVSALLWLIGTCAILYFVLRSEEMKQDYTQKKAKEEITYSIYSLPKSEKLIIAFAIVAALLAINGLTIQYRESFAQFTLIGQFMIGFAALWLGVSFVFIYISFRGGIVIRRFAHDFVEAKTESKKYRIMIENIITPNISKQLLSYNWQLLFTVVAIILGINSILLMYTSAVMIEHVQILSNFIIIIALIWLMGAFLFLYDVLKNTELTEELRRLHGIYKGKIEYTDKMDNRTKMLYSKKHGLRGKPDYIVKLNGKYIPIEVKTGKIPRGPHFSHIIQIAAYCLLIEQNYKTRPPYGIISYSKEQKHKITYDDDLKKLLLEKMDEMRKCIQLEEVHRNHKRPGKCRSCSRRDKCPEKLE
jgi:CRISPR-associated exonuclease Cas4